MPIRCGYTLLELRLPIRAKRQRSVAASDRRRSRPVVLRSLERTESQSVLDRGREDYFKLYRHTVDAIKSVDASLQVGGPATARDAWIEEFVHFCEKREVPLDFVSTHHYPTDALWNELQTPSCNWPGAGAASCGNGRRTRAAAPARDPSTTPSGTPRPTRAIICTTNLTLRPSSSKTVMEASEIVDGYSFWTFSDIFEENYFPSAPFHGGFGLLTLHGIPKPAYRAFELLHQLGDERLLVDGLHHTVDAFVARGSNMVTVLLTNHALPRHSIETERVRITLSAASKPRQVVCRRIDGDNANTEREWRALGSPAYLDADIVDRLQDASRVPRDSLSCAYTDAVCHFDITMPAHAVAAVTLEC